MPDQAGYITVEILFTASAAGACNLCLQRNRPEEALFFIKPLEGMTLHFDYCPRCWRHLRFLADGCLDALPQQLPLEGRAEAAVAAWQFKGGDPLRLFWPPAAELAAWRRLAAERRTVPATTKG